MEAALDRWGGMGEGEKARLGVGVGEWPRPIGLSRKFVMDVEDEEIADSGAEP